MLDVEKGAAVEAVEMAAALDDVAPSGYDSISVPMLYGGGVLLVCCCGIPVLYKVKTHEDKYHAEEREEKEEKRAAKRAAKGKGKGMEDPLLAQQYYSQDQWGQQP